MRTTVIPAQITTVEDKIAGNLNLTQIILLLIPVIWTTAVYTFIPPRMSLLWYKFPLILLVFLICLILAVRVKGKIILNWLAILLSYNLRPKYYLYNKNDTCLRTIDFPVFEKKPIKLWLPSFNKAKTNEDTKPAIPNFSITDLIKAETFLNGSRFSLSFKASKKGGFNVVFDQK